MQPRDELESVLYEASMPNKTVIITVVNKAYVEGDKPMLDLFLDGFWYGEDTRDLVNHLLIVAMDQTSFDRCKFLHLHCYKLETEGVHFASEKIYMSEDFLKMMWRRTLFLGEVLKHGYNFIFTDTDVIWLRSPFPRLSQNKSIDLQVSVDGFNGDQWSKSNPVNTGFYFARSNNKTIALYEALHAKKDITPGQKEQDVLQGMIRNGEVDKIGIKIRYIDTLYFSGFCQNSRDFNVVSTVHANCCRTIRAKLSDLTAVIHDWSRYKATVANGTMTIGWTKHLACMNSWKR
ncbi:Nucleotide-diphospho-sugar transferase [Dillenia turbinata]|uniref:Nucleotide-diphospho-sugar transferase n=1 Tax=Dillenia turbinata TaxID=194707 RepID=A0AAN8V2E2_9MAGN